MDNISYKWSLGTPEVILNVDGITNVVSKLSWAITATDSSDNNYRAVYSTTTNFPPPYGSEFIPFQELSKDNVISWIESIEDIAQVKEYLANQIDLQKNPVTAIIDFPFANKEINP